MAVGVGLLPGAPALRDAIPVLSEAQARAEGLGLLLGPVAGRLSIWAPGDKAAPVCVDFLGGRQGYRLAADRARHERLVKALGRPKHASPCVADLTAGLGRDAALMAAAGFHVTLAERQPVLHALLADGLARAANSELAARLTLLEPGEAIQWRPSRGADPYAVYLDPMFPARDKSAAVKQDLRWLQALCPYPNADEERGLLAYARGLAREKIIVKRPRRAPPLAGEAPHHQHQGKTVRFDVYLPVPAV